MTVKRVVMPVTAMILRKRRLDLFSVRWRSLFQDMTSR